MELRPGGRGDFIVSVDGKSIWDKRRMDDAFPDDAQIVAALKG